MSAHLAASASRRLPVRRRLDLAAQSHMYRGRQNWIVKEPLGMKYYRFNPEEYALLEMLDGRASLNDLKRQFENRFAPQKIALEELHGFVGQLQQANLLISQVEGEGERLAQRRKRRSRMAWIAGLGSLLCIRLPGVDPHRVLELLAPLTRPLFSRAAVVLSLLLWVSALALLAVEFDVFLQRLPQFEHFFHPGNIIWLGVTLAGAKVLHELGHALVCKRFGGQCQEIGLMFLVFAPCLYANVSDSWLLPNKWHRAAVAAAGMYVELTLAALATFIWWFSVPGMLHHLALNVMFVCSVTTLAFNANPLMRYDGYYILADLLEIPNLRQKASLLLQNGLSRICLGIRPAVDPFLPQRGRWLFVAYGISAGIYRWVLTFSIFYMLHTALRPHRLEILGQIVAVTAATMLVVAPVVRVIRFFWKPGRVEKVSRPRFMLSLAVVAGAVGAAALAPLPYHIYCPLEIRPADADPIYVELGGQLESIAARPAQRVRLGDPLVQLRNVDAELAVGQLAGRQTRLQAQLDLMQQQRFRNPALGLQMTQVQEALASIEQQLEQKRQDARRLTLTASRDGVVLPAPAVARKPEQGRTARSWSGGVFEERNLGCYLPPRTLVCLIGDPRKMEAALVVDQGEVELLQPGDEVEIALHQLPGRRLRGQVAEIASSELLDPPRQLSSKSGGELATFTDPAGVERPLSTSYTVLAPLDDEQELLRIGLTGQAKIHAGNRTLLWRAARYLYQTFRLQ